MRHLLSLAALAVILMNGCRSCTTMPTPIVGDSMSCWGATENSSRDCQPQTVDFRGALAKLTCGFQRGGSSCWGCNKYDDFSGPGACRDGVGGVLGGRPMSCPAPLGCQPRSTRGPLAANGLTPIPMAEAPQTGPTTGMPMMGGLACPPAMEGINALACRDGGQPAWGCGGQGCAGRCGGRCAAAQAKAQCGSSATGPRYPNLPHPLGNLHRACAYGKCGARPGPEQGSVSFPYYTVRGPRDFLAADPPSIGP